MLEISRQKVGRGVAMTLSANPSVRWHGMETLRHEIEAAEVEREDLVKATPKKRTVVNSFCAK
eukprot:5635732-Amphidinium_carterae.1